MEASLTIEERLQKRQEAMDEFRAKGWTIAIRDPQV